MSEFIPGTIIKGVGGAYTVAADQGIFICTARGVFRNRQITPLVGDKVHIGQVDNEKKTGVLTEILPRKNELTRPKAVNMDQVIITMAAAQPQFDRGLLDRFLLLAEYANIPPVICINKSDLQTNHDFSMYEEAGYPILFTSLKEGKGMNALREMATDKVSVFAGPSGVGKSSLINWLTDDGIKQETGALSEKIQRGKHTTRHTELLPLQPSGFCVDTPGFTSLDVNVIPLQTYASLFREFIPHIGKCRFSDCRHVKEQDCAIKAQVGLTIHPMRYERYIYLMKR